MKTIRYSIMTAGAVLATGGILHAIEAPADDAPPPRTAEAPPVENTAPAPEASSSAGSPRARFAPPPPAREKTAYLGTVAGEMPGVLSDQLGLEKGVGVVIESLDPDGPAKKAGLRENDVLLKTGGETVSRPGDVSRAVGDRKPGDVLALELIRRGKPLNLDVTLGERPAGLSVADRNDGGIRGGLRFRGLPDDMARRLQGMIEENVGGVNWNALDEIEKHMNGIGGDSGDAGIHEKMDKAIEQARGQMKKARGRMKDFRFGSSSRATISMMDGQGSLEMKSDDGSKNLTVRDKDGKIIWSGPWNSDGDKSAAPADVRRRVEAMNFETFGEGNGFRFQFNSGGGPEDDGIR